VADQEQRLEAAEERVAFGKHSEVTGTLRVNVVTRTAEQTVEGTVDTEDIDIHRVRVDRWVDGPVPPRQDGDTTILSLVEEVVVVEKRLRVFEEIHLSRKRTSRQIRQEVPVRRQEVVIDRPAAPEASEHPEH
jgi:stress response protein YsnF